MMEMNPKDLLSFVKRKIKSFEQVKKGTPSQAALRLEK